MSNDFRISNEPVEMDLEMIHDFLSNRSYWAQGRTMQEVQKSIDNSMVFGMFIDSNQIGFARVVTDFTVYAFIMDLFIIEEERGKGYGKELMNCIMNHEDLKALKRWGLNTRDAHGLYEQFGFTPLKEPSICMEITDVAW